MNARSTLPNRREHFVFQFVFEGATYVAGYSCFPDGGLAELFLQSRKPNCERDIAAKDAAIVCSIALQHGVPVSTIRHALQRTDDGAAAGALARALDLIAVGAGA